MEPLTQEIKAISFRPDSQSLSQLLSEISAAEDKKGKGLLSVVVVRKDNGMPGDGFFDLASKLGRDVSDRQGLFGRELSTVHARWRRSQAGVE
jgi:hypothetical protein